MFFGAQQRDKPAGKVFGITLDLSSSAAHLGPEVNLAMTAIRRVWRGARFPVILALAVLLWGCSKSPAPEPAGSELKSAAAPALAPAQPAMDEDLPPIVRTPWKGDLDDMAKRRVVRVLLPFRKPEFFYMDGRPAGLLQETFQELERVLNAKYKTTASNRIVVALLPTAADKLRERMLGGYGDITAYGISITEENKQAVDFTIPTLTGSKIIVMTGLGAPELRTIEDLSGKEVWVMPHTRFANDLGALNARLRSQGKAPAIMREADPLLDRPDIIEMANAGTYPIVLMQSTMAEFWAQVFDNVKARMDLVVADNVELGWAIQKGTPQLKAFLDDFIKTHGAGTSFGNAITQVPEGYEVRQERQEHVRTQKAPGNRSDLPEVRQRLPIRLPFAGGARLSGVRA